MFNNFYIAKNVRTIYLLTAKFIQLAPTLLAVSPTPNNKNKLLTV